MKFIDKLRGTFFPERSKERDSIVKENSSGF